MNTQHNYAKLYTNVPVTLNVETKTLHSYRLLCGIPHKRSLISTNPFSPTQTGRAAENKLYALLLFSEQFYSESKN